MQLDFDFEVTGTLQDDAYLSEEDIQLMFDRTREDLGSGIRRKLGGISCVEHGLPAHVLVRGIYDRESEQMEVNYSVEPCCQAFMLRVVQVLHRIG